MMNNNPEQENPKPKLNLVQLKSKLIDRISKNQQLNKWDIYHYNNLAGLATITKIIQGNRKHNL